MKRTLTLLLAMAMLVATAAPAMAVAPDATQATDDNVFAAAETTTETNETTADDTPPGTMLAGSIGVHEAEMKGAIEQRSFGIQVRDAATNESKAQVLNRTQERLHDRVGDLEQRRDRLETARDNGSISESQYRAQVAMMAAESAQVQTMANATERTAGQLPEETLRANGVNVTALHQIRDRAHDMSGPKVAQIARQVAGNNVGHPMGPPENVPGHQSGPQGGMDDGQQDGMDDGQQDGMNDGQQDGTTQDGMAGTTQGGNGQGGMTMETTTSDDATNETDDTTTTTTRGGA